MTPDQLRAIAQILSYLNTANSREDEGVLGENDITVTGLTFDFSDGNTASVTWNGETLTLDV